MSASENIKPVMQVKLFPGSGIIQVNYQNAFWGCGVISMTPGWIVFIELKYNSVLSYILGAPTLSEYQALTTSGYTHFIF